MADILDARVLDLFAGSGALGVEALSRGAKSVEFIENNVKTATQLKKSLELLCTNSNKTQNNDKTHNNKLWTVHCGDAENWLQQSTHAYLPFNIIFIDPPFAENLWQSSVEALEQHSVMADGTLVYIEHPHNIQPSLPAKLHLKKSKRTGNVMMNLYEYLSTRQNEQ